MGVKGNFARDLAANLTEKVTLCLMKAGEDTVRYVRDRDAEHSWKDHTGNLRSSVGYGVYVEGQQAVQGGFKPTSAPEGEGGEGQTTGMEKLNQADKSGKYSLIVVAGMDYASEVEARGRDVLASGELFAKEELNKNLSMIRL